MTDAKLAELREAAEKAEKVAPGPWDSDSERQDDAPTRHSEFALFDARGLRLLGTENCDWRFGLIETEDDEDGSTSWNEPSRLVIDFIKRLSGKDVLALLDTLASKSERIKTLEAALEPFADFGELIDLETEGFDDADELEMTFPESGIVLDRKRVGDFRRAHRALTSTTPPAPDGAERHG